MNLKFNLRMKFAGEHSIIGNIIYRGELMEKGLLIVISGPSGAGKGTICKELLKSSNVEISISATTRQPRAGEVEGENYYFISKEEFLEKLENDAFLEHAEVYGNYYGTLREPILEKIELGKDVILEIDIQGALQVKDRYSNGIFVFILPPTLKELKKRIVNRGTETEEAIKKRFGSALKEMSYIDKYDYCVVNDEVDLAADKVRTIIEAEKYKVTDDIYKLIERYREEI